MLLIPAESSGCISAEDSGLWLDCKSHLSWYVVSILMNNFDKEEKDKVRSSMMCTL